MTDNMLKTIQLRFVGVLFFGTLLKGCFSQQQSTPTTLPLIRFAHEYPAVFCFETFKDVQLEQYTVYGISSIVLDASVIDFFGQCIWTGVFRNPHSGFLIEVALQIIDGLDQGRNFIALGTGSDPNDDSSLLFQRTGHSSSDLLKLRNHFHLKTLYIHSDAFWVNLTQSAASNILQMNIRMELVNRAANCSSGQFTCSDGSCIDERGVLNGYPDCPDGSDESPDLGFRDCTMQSTPPAFHYFYTGNLTHDSCTPWEETQYSDRGLYGKICRSIPESYVQWPGCWRAGNEPGTFEWIRCPIPSCEIRAGCYHGNGTDYVDTGEHTMSGYNCINWDAVPPDVFDLQLYPNTDFSDSYCRNPDGREKPWCFYFDGKDNLQSDLCAIDMCMNDFLQQFRRYTKVTFDITSYRYFDIGNDPPEILSEAACAQRCIEEQGLNCRSFTFRYEGTTGFASDSCKWSEAAPTTVGPEDVFLKADEEDTFVNIARECDPFLVDRLPAGCPLPLGMKADLYDVDVNSSKQPRIYDDNITASSALGDDHAPQFARFGSSSCWRPSALDSEPWIQIDLDGLHILTGIVVQACGAEFPDWVYEFTVQSKTASNPFTSHVDRRTRTLILNGNIESRCPRLVEFDPRIYAESLRILPVSSRGSTGMRFELLGCRDGCDFSTGLTDKQAFDASITASSASGPEYNPHNARIQPLGIQSNVDLGWSPGTRRNIEPWIQISYSEHQVVHAIITQGCPSSNSFMSSFILYYTDEQDADDEDDIYPFRDPSTGDVMVFAANSDPEALVRNDLPHEIKAMFVRLIPVTWGTPDFPCLKFEVIGCPYKICGDPLKVGTGTLGEKITLIGQGRCTPESFLLNGPSASGSSSTSISTPRIVMTDMEVELPEEYSITAIVMQGSLNNNGEWATKFSLEYAREVDDGFGFGYRPYVRLNGEREVFDANEDSITPVVTELDRPLTATKLKITYYNDLVMSVVGPCIRFDLMGCKPQERGYPCGPGGIKTSGYCMGSVSNDRNDACSSIFHYTSRLAVLSNPNIVYDVSFYFRDILLEGYSHYRIGLHPFSDPSAKDFVWEDGTPLLYPENFDEDLEIDFSSMLCVTIDVVDEMSWKALSCRSAEVKSASLCQFDIDECLQETDDCSDGCINFSGGFMCSCPHGSFLDTEEQHDCESLCNVFEMDTISSISDACGKFYSGASFERALEVCKQSRGRLLQEDEFISLVQEWEGILQTQRVWIEPDDPQDSNCYVAEVDNMLNQVDKTATDCNTNNTFVCVLDGLPQTFKFNTSTPGSNYTLTEDALYLIWSGLPPWYDSLTSASLDIKVEPNLIIRLYFVYMVLRLNGDDGSCLDKLILWENLFSGEKRMQGEYCGNLMGFNLESNANHVTLTLEIGELRRDLPRYLTLQLLYESRDCVTQQCNLYCEAGGSDITEPQGQLQTFNFPDDLPPYYSCVWTIFLPEGSFVKLIFQEVFIPCIPNYFIKVFSRQLPDSELLDETTYSSLCELTDTWTISETNKLVISYETGLNQQSRGFKAVYETSDIPGCRMDPKEEDEDICSETECNFPRAYVASPNYPLPFSEPLICLWRITTSPRSYIKFRFLEINVHDVTPCENNYVIITEGNREVRFCGVAHEQLPLYISDRNKIDVQFSDPDGKFLALYEEKVFIPSTPLALESDSGYTCPDGSRLYDKRCFVLISADTLITWTEALSFCLGVTETSNLVSIRNKADMNFIHSLILNGTHDAVDFYIGLYVDPEEGHYKWADGSPLSYTDWFARKYEYLDIQPEGSRTESCTAIEMRSFRVTDNWFDIPCAERTTGNFICSQPAAHPNDSYAVYTPTILRNLACDIGYHRFGETCVKLVSAKNSVSLCPEESGVATRLFVISNLPQFVYYLSYIWHTSDDVSSIGVFTFHNSTMEVLCFQRLLGTFQLDYSSCSPEEMFILCGKNVADRDQNCSSSQFRCGSGECLNTVFVCDFVLDCQDGSDEEGCPTAKNENEVLMEDCLPDHFKCNDGVCIHISFVCDFVKNCPDESDERNCEYPACETNEVQCTNKQCVPEEKWCDLIPDCADGSDEVFCVTTENGFQCYSGDWLPSHGFCDGQRDCPGRGFEDEPETCDYLQTNFSCDASRQILCKNGACADRTTLCLMDRDEYGFVKGCRDVTHLQYCDRFECPDLFYKCPNSYCVPEHYRCDGKQDCPQGEDEIQCEMYSCQGAYKCRNSKSCVSLRHVCDGVFQCPEGDDEYFCGNECPESCVCSGLSYSCQNVAWRTDLMTTIPKNIKQLSLVSLESSQRTKRQSKEKLEITLYDATFLSLEIYPFLFTLDLSKNGITHLGNRNFILNSNLQVLNLSFNDIITLDHTTFVGLNKLKTLDLRGNLLTDVTGSPFESLRLLTFLSLQDSSIITSDPEFVIGLDSIQIFRSDRFYYCCLFEGYKTFTECLPPPDEFSSCSDLIQSVVQKVMIWIMALCALSGNIFVIILRICKKRNKGQNEKNPAQPMLIMNLAIADLMMGCYLLMIAIADLSYRGRYGLFSEIWQTSFYCRIAGFLSTVSSIASVIFLTVISIDRCQRVLYPLSPRRLRAKSTANVCLCIWAVMAIISALPAIIFEGTYYGRSSVCLALPITSARPSGWAYSFVLFIILNFFLFIVIVTCYTIIFIIARRSTKFSTSASKTDEQVTQEQLQIARKVSILVASDFFCWMPIIIMGFLALTPRAVTGDVYAWTAIVILPINSAVNPYLYTFLIERASRSKQSSLSKSLTNSDNRVLLTANSSPVVQRAAIPVVSESGQSGVTKTALSAMRTNRVIAPSDKKRYRSNQLSTLMSKQSFELTKENKEDIIEDVRKALQHLHDIGVVHGEIDSEHVIIDELPHGNKRAYLLMPSAAKPDHMNNEAKTLGIELTEMNVKKVNTGRFEKDLQQFEKFCVNFRSIGLSA